MIITDAARTKIEDICRAADKMVRLAIIAGGCHGFNKVWDVVDDISTDDRQFQCGNGVLLIDQTSMDILNEATIDHVNDLGGSYFTIEIPESTGTCGCGNSFSI